MKKAVLLTALLGSLAMAEDLGTVNVESSTINVKGDLATESSKVEVVDEEMLETIGAKNLIDVLKTIPGVTSVARSGEMFQVRFRGVGQQQFMGEKPGVAIIVDGVPVMSDAGGFKLNMQNVKSIKVVKGSASYLYGDTALAGAIVITTKQTKNKNESVARVEYGSYNYQEYAVGTTQGTEDYSFTLNGSYRKTDGYWEDAELWTKSVNGKFQYYLDDSSDITVGIDNTDKFDEGGTRSSVSGVTEAENNPKGEPNSGYTKDSGIDLDKYYLTYNKEFENNSNLNVTAYLYSDLYEQISNPQDTDSDATTPDVYVKEGHEDLVQQGVKTEYTTKNSDIASLVGLEMGQREYKNKSKTLADYSSYNYHTHSNTNYYAGETSDTNSKEEVNALYGEIKYKTTESLTTVANARYNTQKKEYITDAYDYNGSTWSDTTTSEEHTFTNTAYRLGTTYDIDKSVAIFASIATGYETPDISDLESNPDIKDQTSINYEVGTRGNTDAKLAYEVSVYQLDNKDIIGPEGGTYAFGDDMDNIGDSRHQGVEVSLNSDNTQTFSVGLAYTYLDAKYTKHKPFNLSDDYTDRTASTTYDLVGKELPRVSKHTVDLFLNYKLTANFKFITELFAKSDYWADEANLVKMDGYGVINIQARYNIKMAKSNLEIFAKIDNLLDNQYYRSAFLHRDKRAPVGLDKEDISITVDPGRVYYADVKYKF